MSQEDPSFGPYIRQLREERRKKDPAFSLRRFAQAIDVSAAFLSKLEIGEALPPKAEKIIRIAKLLEVDPDELLALAGKVDPSLPEMIIGKPQIADFLRSINKLSNEKFEELRKKVNRGEI